MKIAGLYEFLRQVKLLAPVPDDELHALVERLEVVVYQLGDVVLRRGDPGDAFYIVYSGKARVVDDANAARPITLAVLGPGDTFGEQALVNRAPRGATVRASSTLTLLRLSAADFDALTAAHPALLEAFRERIRADTEFNFLRRLHFLPHLTPAETATLMAALDRVPLAAGEFLFREGEEGDSCYLIREGRLDIYKGSGQGRVKLASLGPGALVGEMSLLYGQPRSADAVAAEPTMLLGFRREVFER
ncbi:MAG TPA: cyclic nucleotide-binding domain-containing protein, partial [Bryobacteraceae bacterium]|nr:cyclic nucleotide-binding domain-containing protein [Bryobacteraceae bacterium]